MQKPLCGEGLEECDDVFYCSSFWSFLSHVLLGERVKIALWIALAISSSVIPSVSRSSTSAIFLVEVLKIPHGLSFGLRRWIELTERFLSLIYSIAVSSLVRTFSSSRVGIGWISSFSIIASLISQTSSAIHTKSFSARSIASCFSSKVTSFFSR